MAQAAPAARLLPGLPEPGPSPAWAPPAPATWSLKGGARVLYHQHGDVPLVSLVLVVPRGAETDPPGKDGLTSLMSDLLDEGAGELDALALSEKLRALATQLEITVNTDGVVLTMNLISENFGRSVELLADVARRPRWDQQEFQRRKAQLIAQALASEADPQYGRRSALLRGLFGTGYAGGQLHGTRSSLESIGFADVKAHYQRLMAAADSTLIVTGGIERETVEKELERAFGDWGGEPSTQERPLAASPVTNKLYLVNYSGAAQSAIGVVRRAPGADAGDLFATTVFNRSFGEAFTSRVNLNLREDKGYTYGSVSVFHRYRRAGLFGIFSDVRSDVTRASLEEILRELSQVCGSRPLVAEEREDSVRGLLLGYPATFENAQRIAARFSQLALQAHPLDWLERWPQRIAAVTLEQANQAARSYCERPGLQLLVAGDVEKVGPSLADIGFELVEVDAHGEPRG